MAVLFDLDGVLIDSLDLHRRVWSHWAQGHGLDPQLVFAATFGRRPADTIAEVAAHLAVEAELRRLEGLLDAWGEAVALQPGAQEAVAIASAGPWGIVTSTDRARTLRWLERLGCPVPRVIIGADDVTRGKPAPDGYLAAAQRLGVEPQSCLVVEDAPAGIAAARAAGASVMAVATTRRPEELIAEAHAVVADLAAASVLLRAWVGADDTDRASGWWLRQGPSLPGGAQ